jgi:hypothetical protein
MILEQIAQLKASGFNPDGRLIIWHDDLKASTIQAAIEQGYMTRTFYQHLYGQTEYTLTNKGIALIDCD